MEIVDLSPSIQDFADTAAIAVLDLVITIDTMVANVIGARGVRVWVAVPFVPDWRWRNGGRRPEWYPRATIYVQP
jgi:hypothetical protein